MFDARKQKDNVVQWIKTWFDKNGYDCNAVVGISGGKDSSVTAALCVEALGKDRVIGVMMPNGMQGDIDDSREICYFLGIKNYTINILPIIRTFELSFSLSDVWAGSNLESHPQPSMQSKINLLPRIRMAALYYTAQSYNGRVANTCNLSEDYVGYSTKYGDAAGDFAPLKSFTSEEVIAIGKELGLPENLLMKAPADGLCGKTDEDNLGFTYAVLNKYIRTGEIEDLTIKEKIDYLHKKNEFKEKIIERYIPE